MTGIAGVHKPVGATDTLPGKFINLWQGDWIR